LKNTFVGSTGYEGEAQQRILLEVASFSLSQTTQYTHKNET
jgi:hypothetical protein